MILGGNAAPPTARNIPFFAAKLGVLGVWSVPGQLIQAQGVGYDACTAFATACRVKPAHWASRDTCRACCARSNWPFASRLTRSINARYVSFRLRSDAS